MSSKKDNASLIARLFRLFVILLSLWVGLFLAFPDALTYSKYAALNGMMVSKYINWHNAYFWVAIGAPAGVYVFAFNNLYRFTVLVLSDLYKVRFYNLATVRYCGFAAILVLSLISMVPFYGMAYQAGVPMPFVLANSFARFCMNTFAFFFLWNYMIDQFVLHRSTARAAASDKIDRLLYALATSTIPITEIRAKPDMLWVDTILQKYDLPSYHELPAQGVFLRVVSVLSFSVGVIAGLYLYNFAVVAANHMGWGSLSTTVASLGVIPTCLLWGHDARFSWRTPVRFLLRNGISPRDWMRHIYYSKPLKFLFLMLIVFGVLFIALPATLSETMMAWHTTHGFMRSLMEWVAAPAFIGIYITGIVEMLCRIVDWLQSVFYKNSTLTLHQNCTHHLRFMRQEIMRSRIES